MYLVMKITFHITTDIIEPMWKLLYILEQEHELKAACFHKN